MSNETRSEDTQAAPPDDDDRAATPPGAQGDPEPTPGEDPGPHGNLAQDEEALRQEQQDSDQGEPA